MVAAAAVAEAVEASGESPREPDPRSCQVHPRRTAAPQGALRRPLLKPATCETITAAADMTSSWMLQIRGREGPLVVQDHRPRWESNPPTL